jgi:hypothetical protein
MIDCYEYFDLANIEDSIEMLINLFNMNLDQIENYLLLLAIHCSHPLNSN